MSDLAQFEQRPLLVVIAGPNGAGKTTFYHAHVASSGLPLVNADWLAAELLLDPYQAAKAADELRRGMVQAKESFAFETVFSDPAGDKLGFLQETADQGYTVAVLFIGLSSAKQSIERVAMRVTQGGHDVPIEKLRARYPRTLTNLRAAIDSLPRVLVYDNSDLSAPYRFIAEYHAGEKTRFQGYRPRWLPV